MPAESGLCTRSHALAATVLFGALLATWFAYAPAMGGSLLFDDRVNLGGLAHVHDRVSALDFVATGVASAIGRPLALASFVPQAYAWPDSPEVFLKTNILIHLLNGVLVVWFLYLLGLARKQTEEKASLIAVSAGAIWMLMPLLASSSLMIVQRMTTLSALFALAGAVGYLYARQGIARRPISALVLMTLALGAGASVGILAKESAALIFLLMLAVESVLLGRPDNVPRTVWRAWFSLIFLVPLGVLLFFLASAVPYPESVIIRRDFTALERLATQAGILWKYLHLAFVPNVSSLGPFHDDYSVQRDLLGFSTLFPIFAWALVIVTAVKFRRRAPLFTFAVAWYLLGHLLESTTLDLELYFEHRNYLPIIGPVYAIVGSLGELKPGLRRVAGFVSTAYIGLIGVVLFSISSLWGNPPMAAEIWHAYKPNSNRALGFLASQLEEQRYPYATQRLLNRFIEANPDDYGVRLQALLVACQLDPYSDHIEAIEILETNLSTVRFSFSVPAAFQQLYRLSRIGQCPGIDKISIYRLGESLLKNPAYQSGIIRHNIHVILASMGVDEGNFALTMIHVDQALDANHNPATLAWAIDILNSAGRFDISRELLNDAKNLAPPRNPLAALRWRQALERIESALFQFEASRGKSSQAVEYETE
jgi:protein O-mannosyl-transferase